MSALVKQRCTYEGCNVTLHGGGNLVHHRDGSHSWDVSASGERRWCVCSLIGHRWDRPLDELHEGWVIVCLRSCCRGTGRGTRWPTLPHRPRPDISAVMRPRTP